MVWSLAISALKPISDILLRFTSKYDVSWKNKRCLSKRYNGLAFEILKGLYEVPSKIVSLTWCLPGNSVIQVGTYFAHIFPDIPKENLNNVLGIFNRLVDDGILEEQKVDNNYSRVFKLSNKIGWNVLNKLFNTK